ncbi:MAG: sugar transferase [Verrucomicrobiae bacterium]|nr:sugar transferase [Verrucomicrobiae bacterium]MCP5541723.1 sugar transferase [Akkermansiaceae bacterium]MCP5551750.1 sugar transferase [Akkermansiaceae bacterium]
MPQRHEIYLKLTQVLDGLMLGLIFIGAHAVRAALVNWFPDLRPIPELERFLWLLAVIVPIAPIVLELQGFYNHPLRKKTGDAPRQILRGLTWLALILGMCVVFLKWNAESRSVLLLFMGVGGVALWIREWVTRRYLVYRVAQSDRHLRTVVAGEPDDMEGVLATMPVEERLQTEIVDRIDLTSEPVGRLENVLRRGAVERVIFAADHVNFRTVEAAIHVCETQGVEAWLAADFMNPNISRMRIEMMGGKPMLVYRSTPDNGWALLAKEAIDRVGAALLILATAPIWLAAAAAIRLASPGAPVVFRQERSGRYGRPFTMLKFRTMHPDAEARRVELEHANQVKGGPAFKLEDDPRVFPLGRLLRKLSIDELPQLWNVMRGDMSLVGPRPLPVYEVEKIEVSAQRRRLSVKPGLTCLWQVSGRSGITEFAEWVRLDLEYIDNWSLWLDWKILFRTVPVVLTGVGAR